jgi:hypothetical protein
MSCDRASGQGSLFKTVGVAARRERYILALLSPGLDPQRQTRLGQRYGCEVIPDVSLEACRAVSDRLVGSVSPARMAELVSGPAAVLKRPVWC